MAYFHHEIRKGVHKLPDYFARSATECLVWQTRCWKKMFDRLAGV